MLSDDKEARGVGGPVLDGLVENLEFGKFGGEVAIAIKGYGLDLKVSEVANATLKEPKVGKTP